MIIRVKKLFFTMPIMVDQSRFMVNIFNSDLNNVLYGMIVIETKPKLSFSYFRDVKYEDDDLLKKEIETIKLYSAKKLKEMGLDINVESVFGAEMGLKATINYEVKKYDEFGNEIVEEKSSTKIM